MAALEKMPKGARHCRSAPPGCRNRAEQWAAKQWPRRWQLTRLAIPARLQMDEGPACLLDLHP